MGVGGSMGEFTGGRVPVLCGMRVGGVLGSQGSLAWIYLEWVDAQGGRDRRVSWWVDW